MGGAAVEGQEVNAKDKLDPWLLTGREGIQR